MRTLFVASLALLVPCAEASSQQPDPQPQPGAYAGGTAILAYAPAPAFSAQLLLAPAAAAAAAVPDVPRAPVLDRAEGRRLSVAGGVGGFLVGAVVGGLVACHFNRDSYDVFCAGQNDTKVFVGAVVGGASGAALGSYLFRSRRR
jgi:hypothetical protein